MTKAVSLHVDAIPLAARQSLEGIIASPLESNEHVIIMTYTPGVPPTGEASAAAHDLLEELRSRVTKYQQSAGILQTEVDAACDEAIQAVRDARRK